MPDRFDEYDKLVAAVNHPMYIVTTIADGERSGCLVGFATQASIGPPRLLVLLSKLNHTLKVAGRAKILVVHFLDKSNVDLAVLFGEQTGDEVDKFAYCDWSEGLDGVPVLRDTAGWVVGGIRDRFDAGDHVAHLVDVVEAEAHRPGPQLGFQDIRDIRPGHPA